MNLRFWKKAPLPSIPPYVPPVKAPEAVEPHLPISVPPEEAPAAVEPVTPKAIVVEQVSAEPSLGDSSKCPDCGADVEPNSKFCTQCAKRLQGGEEKAGVPIPPTPVYGRKGKKKIEGGVEPWAAKAGESVKRVPRGLKIGLPIVLLVIIAILVTLFVLSSTHSPESTVSRYLGDLQTGNYKEAYNLLSHPGGRYSTYDYFQKWQATQSEAIGKLLDFNVEPRKVQNKFFGKLISTVPTTGTPFVATLKYKDQTFDVNMTVEEAGGTWPVKEWRIKLSEQKTNLLIAPLGSRIFIDGVPAGTAEPNPDLQQALQLRHFPKDIDGAVDYARKIVKTIQFLIGEFKQIANDLADVTESAQRVVNRFGTSGVTWSDIIDAAGSTVDQSKSFGQEVARTAVHLYWIFGGGDDGSIRANLTRVESGLVVNNLPEGWHMVSARLPGADSDSKDFIAPQEFEMTLSPTTATEDALKSAMSAYYAAVTTAEFNLNTAVLNGALADGALNDEINVVLNLMGKGQHVQSQLTAVRYENIKLLNEAVATVETTETWNTTTFQGQSVVAQQNGVKRHMIYTLEQKGNIGAWKVIERKQL